MADAGLKVTNANGVVQIDSNYRNFHMINKVSSPHYYDRATGKAEGALASYKPLRSNSIIAYGLDPWYPDVDIKPLSAVTVKDYWGSSVPSARHSQPFFRYYGKTSYDSHILNSLAKPGEHNFAGVTTASYTKKVTQGSSGYIYEYGEVSFRGAMPTKADNINFNVYEFDLVDLEQSASKLGMQVFDEGGNMVFDSNYKPMRVVKFFTAPPAYTPSGTPLPRNVNVWDLPVKDGSRKYAIAPLGTPHRYYNQYVAGYYDGRDYVTSSGNSIQDSFVFQRSRILHDIEPIPIDSRDLYQYLYTGADAVSYLLLDVTGY